MNRRDILRLLAACLAVPAATLAGSGGARPGLDPTGLALLQELSADPNGADRAHSVLALAVEGAPERTRQALAAVEALARTRFDASFHLLEPSRRREIIKEIYAQHPDVRRFCAGLVRLYYDEAYKWVLVGYRPAPHVQFKTEDPEFDSYAQPCLLMEPRP